jgi:hypothetical protein
VQMKSRMALEPGFDPRMLVRGVIIRDQMQVQLGRCLRVDLLEEPDELLMAVTWHAVANDLAVEHAPTTAAPGPCRVYSNAWHWRVSCAAWLRQPPGFWPPRCGACGPDAVRLSPAPPSAGPETVRAKAGSSGAIGPTPRQCPDWSCHRPPGG